jgi:membrane protein implicated in regulation of membrane protease activity
MSHVQIWLVAGAVLCVMELVLPTAFVESTLGVSAFLVAMVALVVPSLTVQIVLWVLLSIVFILLLRRFAPQQTPYVLQSSTEARTLTPILPGETGRVLYEGNSWQARCEDDSATIAENQRVTVTRRRGNTLYVMSEKLLDG